MILETEVEHNRVPWLDFCRALAICLVLFGHGRGLLLPNLPWLAHIKLGGFLGVELFFVLSGFLVGGILIKANSNSISSFGWIPTFWGRRWLRTLPNYYFFLFVNIVLLIYGIRPESVDSYWPYFFFLQNLAWPHPLFFGEAWSLAVEEMFYFLTPIAIGVICLLTRSKESGLLLTIGLIFTASVIAKFVYVEIYNPAYDSGIRKIVLLRLDSLMIGVFLAWITSSIKASGSKKTIRKMGIFLLPLILCHPVFFSLADDSFDQSYFARTWLFLTTSIGCAGLILAGLYSVHLPKCLTWVSSRIAKLSYSAYLVHSPVLATINILLGADQLSGYIKWLMYISLTFLFSSITYRLIERPFLYYRDRVIPSGSLRVSDLGVVPKQ